MAEFTLATGSEKQVWSNEYWVSYIRRSRFDRFMGGGMDNIFLTKTELQREAGKTINIAWIGRLRAPGVYNDGVLEGNEEALPNANFPISVNWIRNGVVLPKSVTYKTEINMMDASKTALRSWSATKMRDSIIIEILGTATTTLNQNRPFVPVLGNGGAVIKAVATAAEMNSWITTNSDRVIFGSSRANNTGTFSTSAANVDSTNDKLSTALVSLMKLMARETEGSTTPITPYMNEDGREYFVLFVGSRAMRDLKQDSAMVQANRDARERNVETNPLFQDGDLIWDGVIIREEPAITSLLTTQSTFLAASGASSIPVEPVFLCGAGAGAVAWGQRPTPRTQEFDYRFRPGAAIEELRGLEKLNYNGLQNGMVTGFVSGSAT